MSGPAGTACCETFVEALGLKSLFSTFMSKASKKHKSQTEDISHTLGMVSSLFTNLASDSPARIRLLAKFVENTYEKADKLIEIRDAAQGRLKEVEAEIDAEKKACRIVSIFGLVRLTYAAGSCRRGRKDRFGDGRYLVPPQTRRRAVHATNRGLHPRVDSNGRRRGASHMRSSAVTLI